MSLEHARQLRKEMTDTERFAWYRLRKRQLAGHKFRRQVPLGSYIADFVCLESRLILEFDGGQHAERVVYDERRTRWLESQGFRVMRFWNIDVLKEWEAVEQVILRALTGSTPHPNPPPHGGRGPNRFPYGGSRQHRSEARP
jgi:very-short-patch-repair endonuclease